MEHAQQGRWTGLKKEEEAKLTRLAEIEKQQAKLAAGSSLSLPGDPDMARLEYEKYLNQLFTRHKIATGREITPRNADTKSSPTIGPNKEPIYTKLTFTVQAYATMANLVGDAGGLLQDRADARDQEPVDPAPADDHPPGARPTSWTCA